MTNFLGAGLFSTQKWLVAYQFSICCLVLGACCSLLTTLVVSIFTIIASAHWDVDEWIQQLDCLPPTLLLPFFYSCFTLWETTPLGLWGSMQKVWS